MTVFYLIAIPAGILVAVFLAFASPLFRSPGEPITNERRDRLRRRIEAIEHDRISGLIGDGEAAEAIIDAKRAAIASNNEQASAGKSRLLRFLAIAFLALTPAAAGLLYFEVGSPMLNNMAASPSTLASDAGSIAMLPESDRRAMIEGMVASLAARLEKSPDDAEGWRMLARSEFVLGDATGSAASFRRLFMLDDGTVDDWRNFVAALIAAFPEGRFPADEEFLSALDEIEKRAPGDPLVLFYRGGAARELGDPQRAIDLWSRLLEILPADAPVRGTLEMLIAGAHENAGADSVPK